jgi:hypothetical protein
MMPRANSSFSHRQAGTAPAALVPIYEARRRRTIELVTASIEALRVERLVVSLATIAARSRRLDPGGRGVSETAILRNPEARALYQAQRTAAGRGHRRRSAKEGGALPALPMQVTRDLGRTRQRYMRLPKAELVERTLAAEQAFAQERVHRLQTADELLTWMFITGQLMASAGAAGGRGYGREPSPKNDMMLPNEAGARRGP